MLVCILNIKKKSIEEKFMSSIGYMCSKELTQLCR